MRQALLVPLLALLACQNSTPLPSVLVLYVVDGSPGTMVTLRAVEEDLAVLLPEVAHRPGSVLRVYGLPQNPSDLRPLAEVRSTTPSRPARRTVLAHERRFVTTSNDALLPPISAYLSDAHLTRSPIAETLGRLLLTTTPADTRRIIVLASDAAEESDLAHLEGPRALPTTAAFTARLDQAGILQASTACGTLVVFAHCQPRDGSAALRRYDAIKALWTAAITRAGGHVDFTTGPIEAIQ